MADDRTIAPGALTALLEELAREPPGAGWRDPPAPGDRVGRFEVVREVGRGGFGVVYEARDPELGRAVALKTVRPGAAGAARDLRAWAEAEAAARLAHPNIVHLYDAGQDERGTWLVMELLRGEPLRSRLERGALPLQEAVRVGLEMARGVAHAHRHGVVHRDLKPGNVFLCEDGQVKVLDFGLASVLGHEALRGGTGPYMAPEQEAGEPGDARSDVWALGVILHEILTGRRPEGGATQRLPGAPGSLARLVARCLSEDPAARPASAAEVEAALAALASRLATRRRVLASAGVAAVAVAVAAVAIAVKPPPLPPGRLTLAMADTANRSGDPNLGAVGGFLGAALEQSPRISLIARSRLVNVLHAVGGPVPEVLDEGAVTAAAREAGARLLLVPALTPDGNGLKVFVRGVDLERASTRFALDETALGAGSVPDAVDRLVRRVLEALDAPLPADAVPVAEQVSARPEAWRHYDDWLRLRSEGRSTEAREAFERGLAADPEYPGAQLALMIEATDQRGDLEEARRHLELGRRNLHRAPAKERAIFEAMARFLEGGSGQERIRLLQEVGVRWPEDPRPWEWGGVILMNHAADAAAMRPFLEQALVKAPLRPQLRVGYLAALGRLDEALAEARRLSAADEAEGSFYVAAVHRWRGEVAEALAAGRRSVELDPGPWGPSQRWNFVEADAVEELEGRLRPVDRQPGDVQAHWLLLRGRWREALAALDAWGRPADLPDRRRGAFHLARATLLALRGDGGAAAWREVEAAFRLGYDATRCGVLPLALAGDLKRAQLVEDALFVEVGACLVVSHLLARWQGGDREGALRGFEGLYGQGRDYYRGRLLAELGRDREAVEAFRAYRRRPDHPFDSQGDVTSAVYYPRSLLLEAEAHLRLGEPEAAKPLLARLLRLWNRADPDAPYLAQAKALAARLGVTERTPSGASP